MKQFQKNLWAAAVASALGGCGSKADPADTPTEVNRIPVRVQIVAEKSLAVPVQSSGLLASASEVKLSFKTGGVIGRIYAEEGAVVRRGQVLAQLNLSEIDAQVLQARAGHEKARRDLQRVRNLQADSVATLENLQDATTAEEVAAATRRIAEFNRRYSTITAPSNGRILKRFAEPGELIGPGLPVFYLGSSEAAWVVRVGLADRDVVKVKVGDKGVVKLDAYPGETFPATVSQVAGVATPGSGTYEVELQLDPTDKKLVSGFVASAEIRPVAGSAGLVVPVEALVEADGDQAFVYVLNADNATVQKVAVGVKAIHGREAAITSDSLRVGQRLVAEGAAYLYPTAQVQVVQ